MFQNFKNIDTAFRFVRAFSLFFLAGTIILGCYLIYRTTAILHRGQQRIYVLVNGKLIDAQAVEREDSLAVEIRDHVKMFHFYFYSLEPDELVNKRNLTSALYLADNSARQTYDNLTETGYYNNFITGNISQQVPHPDSIVVDGARPPYQFHYYGTLRIIRETSILTRSLVTEGTIRVLGSVSDNNPHGLLIENWKIVENKDLHVEIRNH
jgi:conjugative transposon TraK protein